MLSSAQQQLSAITRKASSLEKNIGVQIAEVKKLKREKDAVDANVEELRRCLAEAETQQQQLQTALDDVTATLKSTAADYSRVQLCRKRFQNSVSELSGACKACVCVREYKGSEGLVVADDCTLNFDKVAFVYDAVVAFDATGSVASLPTAGSASGVPNASLVNNNMSFNTNGSLLLAKHAASQQQDGGAPHDPSLRGAYGKLGGNAVISDVLKGFNCQVLSFGPEHSGKTTLFLGESVAGAAAAPSKRSTTRQLPEGLVALFLQDLFASLEPQGVTHFNFMLSVKEVNCALQHLSGGAVVAAGLDYMQWDLVNDVEMAAGEAADRQHAVTVNDADKCLDVYSQAMRNLVSGGTSKRGRRVGTSPAAVIVTLYAESYNTQGHLRKGKLSLVDLCGPSHSSEAVATNKMFTAVCEGIMTLSDDQNRVSHGRVKSSMPYFLSETFGGNSKTMLVCVVDQEVNSTPDISVALKYAINTKHVICQPYPNDLAPELQKLHVELSDYGLE